MWRFICVGSHIDPSKVIRIVAFFVAGVVIAVGGALIYSAAHGPRPTSSVQVAHGDRRAEHSQARPAPGNPAASNADSETPPNGGETLVAIPEPSAVSLPAHATDTRANRGSTSDSPFGQPTASAGQPDVAAARDRQPGPTTAAARLTPATRPPIQPTSAPGASHPMSLAAGAQMQQEYREQHAAGAQSSLQQAHVVTLEPGLALTIRLAEKLSTAYNYTGDTFRGTPWPNL